MVKKRIVTALENTNQAFTFRLKGYENQQYLYSLSAERNATLIVHFIIGSLDEEQAGTLDLLIQLQALCPSATIIVTASVVTGAGQIHTITTEQLHTAPDTQSSVSIKAAVKEDGVHVYHGIIRLEQGSFRADAKQENKILQLGVRAKISSKPTLQILHDDVQCAHGTAISQLDPEHIFYYQTRGFQKVLAEQFITNSFLVF